MKTSLLSLCLVLWLTNIGSSQGRNAHLAREAYAWANHYSEGYYRAYLNILRKSQLALPEGNSVSVIGEVSKAGEVLYGDGITASKAIADVGGIAPYGDRHHIGVWKNRDGKFVIFSLKSLEEKVAGATDPMLEGGDVVIVLERRIGF